MLAKAPNIRTPSTIQSYSSQTHTDISTSKLLKPQLEVDSGDYITIEAVTHHASDCVLPATTTMRAQRGRRNMRLTRKAAHSSTTYGSPIAPPRCFRSLRAGGAALLPRSLVADDLAQGRLISWGNTPKEIWVLYSSRRLLSSKIAAFVAYLDEVFPKGPP